MLRGHGPATWFSLRRPDKLFPNRSPRNGAVLMWCRTLSLVVLGCLLIVPDLLAQSKFQISIDPAMVRTPAETGRVLLVLQPAGNSPAPRRGRGNEPRFLIGQTGMTAAPYFGT